jgi:hypothetical protein
MIYLSAALCAMFVAYLAHDFYQEQLQARLIPARVRARNALRRIRRNR